jgi:HD-like signal output (HDOD) protein
MRLEEIKKKNFLDKIRALPPLPKIVSKLQDTITGENISINEVTKLIESDVGMVSQILRMINSAYFNLPQKITKVRFAIAFLGLNEIYRICLTLSVINNLKVKDQEALTKYWIYSYLTANLGKNLVMRFSPSLSIEQLFPAAMLHDIGQLIYLKYFPDAYAAIQDLAATEKIPFGEAVTKLGLTKSSSIGSELCIHWRLSDIIVKCCNYHTMEDLEKINQFDHHDLIKINIIASNISTLVLYELTEEHKNRIIEMIKNTLDLDEDQFISLMGDVYESKIEVEDFLAGL